MNAKRRARAVAFGGTKHKQLRPDPRPAKAPWTNKIAAQAARGRTDSTNSRAGSRPRAPRNRVATNPPRGSGKNGANRSWHHATNVSRVSSHGQKSRLRASLLRSPFPVDAQRCRSPHSIRMREGARLRNLSLHADFCSISSVLLRLRLFLSATWQLPSSLSASGAPFGNAVVIRHADSFAFAYPQQRDRPSPQQH